MFADADPEDAWSASDPPAEKVRVLIRWAVSVALEVVDGDPHHRAAFRLNEALEHGLALVRLRHELTDTEHAIVAAAVDLLVSMEQYA